MFFPSEEALDLDFTENTLHYLTQLLTIDLTSNALESLPENIGDLANLRTLNLYQNNLTVLPNSIGNLQLLEELLVSRNKLVE